MTQLIQIKQKIKSIETTKKITHAVRLVSMSFYSKLEKQNVFLQDYKNNLNQLFFELSHLHANWKNPILFPNDILDINPLVIIVSSTKGLCGSFNSNLFRYFDRAYFIEEHQIPTFITVGQKAKNFITEKKLGTVLESHGELTNSNLESITNKILQAITTGPQVYSSVTFYSNWLKNFFVQKPQKKGLIPLSLNSSHNQTKDFENTDLTLEQDEEQILSYLAQRLLKSSIMETLFQSLISEHASRFVSMDSSTTNAENILERLTLQYNKSRQSLITQEVSELSTSLQR